MIKSHFTQSLALLALATCLTPPLAQTAHAADIALPMPPAGVGHEDSAPIPQGVAAYVDTGATNQRGIACMATIETNAGVRVLSGFLDLWTPRSPFVDADQDAPEANGCPPVVKSDWDGIPGSATDGVKKHPELHEANIAYSVKVTSARTPEQALAAYLDDRRNKAYSVTDGLGPLTDAWRKGTRQITTITDMPADAVKVKYEDKGNDRGVGSKDNEDLGKAVDLMNATSENGSTEPAKRYYKYARPYRASDKVIVLPQLEPAKSSKPAADGGFPSGHTAEGWRDALTMAYLVPQRYQEMLTRAARMGENRILAGMHQTFDVLGGRVQATAVVAYNLNRPDYAALKGEAYQQTQTWLGKATGAANLSALLARAHDKTAQDTFGDYAANKAYFTERLTYGYPQITDPNLKPSVPKGAEVLLETRLPYLTAQQRRVVLKTTELPSGYPILNDAEGWGRLNLFAAADGYGAFDGDVTVTMDAAKGGYNAEDSWKNTISGPGRLTKLGSGSLSLNGANTYSGGTLVNGGTLQALSETALGSGDVYIQSGVLKVAANEPLTVGGKLTLLKTGTLDLTVGDKGHGTLKVADRATLAGGKLVLHLAEGYKPAKGKKIQLIGAGSLRGTFSDVSLDGHKLDVAYGKTGVTVTIR
ncbi:acid phosphatase [Rhizobium paknamense]|uniref:Autotransporter-associated beta strand protein n=1 Tax=Rhizobium paknamense TaxID=1206817 RepID=A0ABU0ICR1_9HYPH|nr:phosphatase PAP2 family protein [Rhizobium paknamense]MDQ0455981.1 autotransporter-associated beta strand protein [Rhizobium paknamense]